jgi:hypothetical protein
MACLRPHFFTLFSSVSVTVFLAAPYATKPVSQPTHLKPDDVGSCYIIQLEDDIGVIFQKTGI